MMMINIFDHCIFPIVSRMMLVIIKKLQDDNKTILMHYVLISDLSKLLCKQSKADKRLYYCRRCLQHFRAQEKLDDHVKSCKK